MVNQKIRHRLFLAAFTLILASCGSEKSLDIIPPDPGESGKQTLQGIDSDNDGLRDDLQRWVYLDHQELDDSVKVHITRYIRDQQDLLLTEGKISKKRKLDSIRAKYCFFKHVPNSQDLHNEFAGLFTNTEERFFKGKPSVSDIFSDEEMEGTTQCID